MNTRDEKGPMENLLDGLEQHSKFLSDEELKEELHGRGVDVDAFLKTTEGLIDQHLKADRLAWQRVADQKKKEASESSPHESWFAKGEAAIKIAWAKMLGEETALAFRNRKDLTIEDMARILDDRERLRRRRGNA